MGDHQVEPAAGSKTNIVDEPTVSHAESSQTHSKWKSAKAAADGDVAMALFDNPDELHEEIDPVEARKLLWKIDFMILPYLAVCYAFFYIDKVGDAFDGCILSDYLILMLYLSRQRLVMQLSSVSRKISTSTVPSTTG